MGEFGVRKPGVRVQRGAKVPLTVPKPGGKADPTGVAVSPHRRPGPKLDSDI